MKMDKSIDARIFGCTTQNSTLVMPVGDSVGDAFTQRINPMRGTLLWDKAMYVLNDVAVAGGATGGTYTITVMTNAVRGFTNLPIAQVALVGPNSPTTLNMDNLHQSPGSPIATHVEITQVNGGGGLTMTMDVVGKQYRGTLGTPGGTAERVLQGIMLKGNSAGYATGDDKGVLVSSTFTLGTSGSNLGMNRMHLWDNAFFWAVAGESISGAWDVDIVGKVSGTTTAIASSGVGGALTAAGQKVVLANSFYGQAIVPTAIIYTEETAGGVSDSRVVMLAKGGRGSLAKN